MFLYNSKTVFSCWPLTPKLLIAFLLPGLSFLTQEPLHQAIMLGFVLLLLVIARYSELPKLLLSLLPFILLTDAVFIFLLPEIPNIFRVVLTANLRIYVVLLSFAFFSYTTDVFSIVKAMKRTRIPETVYLSLYIVLRFLPEMEQDLKEIRELNKLKGVSWKKPVRFLQAHFLPLLLIIFQRTEELSIAYFLRKKRENKD